MAMAARLALEALLLFSIERANAAPPPKVRNSCVANNVGWQVAHYDKSTGKTMIEELDDWHVTCKREVDKKVVWQGELTLVHPAELTEALEAMRKYMKEQPK
jgi:hypothetical protein